MAWNSLRYSTLKSQILASAVSMTSLKPKAILRYLVTPIFCYCDCYSYRVVQFACVIFFIDIPSQGSQSLSNSRSLPQRCHIGTAVSLTLLWLCDFEPSLLSWICSVGHSVVIDTAEAALAVLLTQLSLSINFANMKPYSKKLNQEPRWDC
jgi:hypothetical protein